MDLVKIENLRFSYCTSFDDQGPVLKDVNLTVRKGETLAIQGPSGSGKSTLLYVIGCLNQTYEGKVTVFGKDLARLSDRQCAFLRNQKIGFVFQQFYLLPRATVLENILLPNQYPTELPIRADALPRANELAIKMGLGERLDYYPNQLSGGQQQRVSIARALLNETEIILADEPTGSLDTKTSEQILDLLIEASREGRTVIIITHDPEVAKRCDRIVHFRDGRIHEIVENSKPAPFTPSPAEGSTIREAHYSTPRLPNLLSRLIPLAIQNLRQNKTRSVLTMLGIVIGVAAVLAMITIGNFTKKRILDSYAELGVNTMVFFGSPNWQLRALDQVPAIFQSLRMEEDILPLKKLFPEIVGVSPNVQIWGESTVSYGGASIDTDVVVTGTNEEGLAMANRKLSVGNNFSPFQVQARSPVCIIGEEIYARLFSGADPLGKIIFVNQADSSFGCRVIGVMEHFETNKDYAKPNSQIYLPYTFIQANTNPWSARIRSFLVQVAPGTDTQVTGKKIKAFFDMKYGRSGRFEANSDSALISQMNKFLNLFTVLLGAIALVSLGVGELASPT